MKKKSDTERTIAQLTLNYYEANTLAHEARQSLEIACRAWVLANGLQAKPERDTPEWDQMCAATALEYKHLQRAKARKTYTHGQMMRMVAESKGVRSRRWSAPSARDQRNRQQEINEMQKKAVTPQLRHALDKRRLEAVLTAAGLSRNAAVLACKEFLGPSPNK